MRLVWQNLRVFFIMIFFACVRDPPTRIHPRARASTKADTTRRDATRRDARRVESRRKSCLDRLRACVLISFRLRGARLIRRHNRRRHHRYGERHARCASSGVIQRYESSHEALTGLMACARTCLDRRIRCYSVFCVSCSVVGRLRESRLSWCTLMAGSVQWCDEGERMRRNRSLRCDTMCASYALLCVERAGLKRCRLAGLIGCAPDCVARSDARNRLWRR